MQRPPAVNLHKVQPRTPCGPVPATAPNVASPEVNMRGDSNMASVEHEIEEPGVMSRKEEIEALPTFSDATGLEAVDTGITLYVVPLRSGDAKDCYFDETTSASAIGLKVQKVIDLADKAANDVMAGADLASWSIDGKVNVTALRNTSFKNQRCGVIAIRLKEQAGVAMATCMKKSCSVTRTRSSFRKASIRVR